ncbi:interferon-induced transmembrane protein 5-like [Pogoniulus pusillus]|uniref:interferon-induced transmembrane protein 5-like n=1 Tax=Pogoniulus pusillus TaxID=488313 RepID=UPI0030B94418
MKPKQAEVSIPLQPPAPGTAAAAGPDGQPRDFLLWSLLNVLLGFALTFLGCCCFPALVYSIKARDCKVLGDLEGARRHGARAKVLNIIGSVLLVLGVVMVIAIFFSAFLSRTP